ncbi:MAG: N-acetylglucosamine-6-phosphate deacetylase [Alphaproteobacteria bacterium 32-64-14]|nr:MAG: N-acetylglucosamine-6-phosphate deacetylase [Alphaproteobacteria bacterium 32-64-14]
MTVLAPTRLFDGETLRTGAAVVVEDGRISAVLDTAPADGIRIDGLLAPGFIDVQVNGGGGVLFNDAPTVDALRTITAAHQAFGVTGIMATLISDSREKTAAALDAVSGAFAVGVDGLIGLHLEGPWLSEPRRGVHPAANLRPLDEVDLIMLTARRGFPLMVTVAPERVSPDDIRTLAGEGVRVCLGHTAATTERVEEALAAGASGFTHLFNAMPTMESRNPGPVGVALAHTEAFTGLILDGIHVHPVSARAAFRAKTARRMMLVSDAMATVGGGADMELFGEKVSLSEGALRTPSGTLAGAHLDMSGAVRNALAMMWASEAEALRMATRTPAEFLGVDDRGRIASGARADFVLLDSHFKAQGVWIAGKRLS